MRSAQIIYKFNTYKMKKIALTLTAMILAAGVAFAQDMAQATETAKLANEALMTGDNALALQGFQQALSLAEACGEDGAELVNTCKGVIPQIMINLANDCIKAEDYATAITKLEEAAKVAADYGQEEAADKAIKAIPQVFMQQGGALLNAKDFAGAVAAFTSALEKDPENGVAALRLGMALAGTGKADEAVAAFKKAAELGQEGPANKQLGNIYLKKAAAALKAKNFAAAAEAAVESTTYAENPQAFLVAGQSYQQLKKNADAIANFEKYLELSPNAKNANAISFTVAALYQQAGNKDKAKAFYQKVVADPQLGPQAKQQLDALK